MILLGCKTDFCFVDVLALEKNYANLIPNQRPAKISRITSMANNKFCSLPAVSNNYHNNR
jgi:hypothetical protein